MQPASDSSFLNSTSVRQGRSLTYKMFPLCFSHLSKLDLDFQIPVWLITSLSSYIQLFKTRRKTILFSEEQKSFSWLCCPLPSLGLNTTLVRSWYSCFTMPSLLSQVLYLQQLFLSNFRVLDRGSQHCYLPCTDEENKALGSEMEDH